MRAPLYLDRSTPHTGTLAPGTDVTAETPVIVLSTVVIAEAGAPAAAVAAARAVPPAAGVPVPREALPGGAAGNRDAGGRRRGFLASRYRRLPAADLVETLDELRAIWPEGAERPATVADAITVLTDELVTRYRARTA
jgi:hypothetical protein